MSIIYNALTKTQKKRTELQQPIQTKSIPHLKKWIMGFNLLFTISLIVFGSLFIHGMIIKKPLPKKNIEMRLNLQGIYLSNHEKLAVINQTLYPLGSEVKGMQLVRIEDDYVELKKGDEIKRLKVVL